MTVAVVTIYLLEFGKQFLFEIQLHAINSGCLCLRIETNEKIIKITTASYVRISLFDQCACVILFYLFGVILTTHLAHLTFVYI